MNTEEVKKAVKKVFTDYLEKHDHRKTEERYAVLDEVYSMNDHFDIDHLYSQIKAKKHNVSRATVYNTMELLLEANLVMKHQFGKNLALFEKSYAYKQHDHLICDDCEHVFEFCDPRIQQIQSMIGDLLKFNISTIIHYIYSVNAGNWLQTERANTSNVYGLLFTVYC